MKVFSRISQEIKNFIYGLRARSTSIPAIVNYDVPYVCQFATPESAELSLTKKLVPADDPDWKNTGAVSPARYSQWAFTMCGMASVSMALKHFKGNHTQVAQLAEDALQEGVYVEDSKDISSMKYKEFTRWIKKYGLQAEMYTTLSLKGIQLALAEGKLVIVSVNPNIRGYNTAPVIQKGGHLVLVTGYDKTASTVSLNNPSGFVSTNTQIKHTLSEWDFAHYYAGRGILVSPID